MSDSSEWESSLEDSFEIFYEAEFNHNECLSYDPIALETIVLKLIRQFNMRVITGDDCVSESHAAVLKTGLTYAGSIIGNRCGGKLGAVIGGAFGGICSVGIMALCDIWEKEKHRLSQLMEVVYEYLGNVNLVDYKSAMVYLTVHQEASEELAEIIAAVAMETLNKKVIMSKESQEQ